MLSARRDHFGNAQEVAPTQANQGPDLCGLAPGLCLTTYSRRVEATKRPPPIGSNALVKRSSSRNALTKVRMAVVSGSRTAGSAILSPAIARFTTKTPPGRTAASRLSV